MWKRQQNILRNLKQGFRDNDPDKSVEQELKLHEQAVKEWEKLAVAMREAEGLEPSAEMERAWREYLQMWIDYHMQDLEWFQGEGKVSATEAKLKELNDEIAVLKERTEKVKSLPKTVMDVIRSE
jgi:hypothetical protein